MDSKKIYTNLIGKALLEDRVKDDITYYEKHHINPKFNGGNNNKGNIVLLTYREHVLSHWLLTRIFPNNYKAYCAFYCMSTKNKHNKDNRSTLPNSILSIIKNNYSRSKKGINPLINLSDKDRKDIYLKRSKPIICIETQKIFNSMVEAEKLYNINISNCIKSPCSKTAGGYHWMYLKDYNNLKEPPKLIPKGYSKRKKVINLDTDEIFSSALEASKLYNINKSTIRNVCGKVKGYNTAGGYRWSYYIL